MSSSDHHESHMPNGRSRGVSRRNFLKAGALSALALGTGCATAAGTGPVAANGQVTSAADVAERGGARNVIFLVSDGMSIGTLTMAELMRQRRDGRATNWVRLYHEDRTRRGLMDMASRDSIVTDSAAAASSWGSGRRINNGAINMGPDGERYRTILEIFRDAGKATGLVTTARITHATPAGFGINVPARGMEDEIAEQYLERGYDLLLGGGARHFAPGERDDGLNLYQGFREAGYEVARTREELLGYDELPDRLLGTFFDSHLPYEIDRLNLPAYRREVPSLAEMTDRALRRLDRHEEGFILQVEGGRVDHAAHSNDTAGLIFDQLAFDEAVGTALAFAEDRDDTLVILTTDHGNANPGVNGIGSGYRDSNHMFDSIADFTYSNEWIFQELDETSTAEEIRERVNEANPFDITREEAETLRQSLRGEFEAVYRARSSPSAVLSAIQANYTAVNWIGSMHTSDYVELTALGPGSEAIGAFTRNTELFDLMLESAGVAMYAG